MMCVWCVLNIAGDCDARAGCGADVGGAEPAQCELQSLSVRVDCRADQERRESQSDLGVVVRDTLVSCPPKGTMSFQ